MTQHGNLTVHVRDERGKGAARTLRGEGKVPAVMYGAGADNVALALEPEDFRKATDPERDWNTLFALTVKEPGKPDVVQPAMVADVQVDRVSRRVIHVDFVRVDPQAEVVRKIPIEVVGRSVGVVKGGKLQKFRRFVKIAAKPADIPVKLTIDITSLDGGESLRVKDMSLPNVRLIENPEQRLVFVEIPKARKEEAEEQPKGKK
jgi:large subunit ribosomal protein L25